MKDILKNKKLTQGELPSTPRCWWTKKGRKMSASVLIKCGDCKKKVKIHYDIKEDDDFGLEINGVLASKKWWIILFKEIGLFKGEKKK